MCMFLNMHNPIDNTEENKSGFFLGNYKNDSEEPPKACWYYKLSLFQIAAESGPNLSSF